MGRSERAKSVVHREKCGLSPSECYQYHGGFAEDWDFHGTTPMKDKELEEQFLVWVMANRDTPARKWADEIEPELKRQLSDLIAQERRKAKIEVLEWVKRPTNGLEPTEDTIVTRLFDLLARLKEDKEA